jgi:sugar phosphate isomerase/epimerase
VDWDQVHRLKRLGDERDLACHLSGFAPLLAEGEEREVLLGMVRTQLEVSRIIGSEQLRFDGMLNRRLRIGEQAPLGLCTDNLKRVVALAEEAGVTIALEDHMDFRAADFRHFLRAIMSPRLAVTLDTGNLMPVGEDAVAFAAEFAPRIVNCHLKGVHYVFRDFGAVLTSGRPEHSIVDLQAILQTLASCAQDVTAHLEVVAMQSADEEGLVGEYARFLTGCLLAGNEGVTRTRSGG